MIFQYAKEQAYINFVSWYADEGREVSAKNRRNRRIWRILVTKFLIECKINPYEFWKYSKSIIKKYIEEPIKLTDEHREIIKKWLKGIGGELTLNNTLIQPIQYDEMINKLKFQNGIK